MYAFGICFACSCWRPPSSTVLNVSTKNFVAAFTSGVRFGVQDPPMSAGPPDSRRALSSGLFASYSMGLASPLDIRARRKIIVRTDVEIIWASIYRQAGLDQSNAVDSPC